MTHFGIICPTATGHLNPAIALAKELQRRGHQVTFFQVEDARHQVESAGLGFQVMGETEFPLGAMSKFLSHLGHLSGLAAIKYSIHWLQRSTEMILQAAPDKLKQAKIEVLIVDQVVPGGATVAQFAKIPFISLCCALLINQEPSIPPFMTDWQYSTTRWAMLRNKIGYKFMAHLTKPIRETVDKYHQQWGLPLRTSIDAGFSPLAQISQQPPEFEFPRTTLPSSFYFTAPFDDLKTREAIDFPWSKLTGEPLIYASMGTLQNRQLEIFYCIAEACAELPVQLVISLGNQNNSIPELPGSPLIVPYAPQLKLLQKASLTITHAGLNTVLESLRNGVPIVAIPITNDQPGVAARLTWSGAGEFIPVAELNVFKLKSMIQHILTQPTYRENARRLQAAMEGVNGAVVAADIIDRVLVQRQLLPSEAVSS
jgi:zeaxanthin glucosyltransferase